MRRFSAKSVFRVILITALGVLIGKAFETFVTQDGLKTCAEAQSAVVAAVGNVSVPGLLMGVISTAALWAEHFANWTGLHFVGGIWLVPGYLVALVLVPIELVMTASALDWAVIAFELIAGTIIYRKLLTGPKPSGPFDVVMAPFLVILAGTAFASLLWLVLQAGLYLFSGFLQLGAFCLGGGFLVSALYLMPFQYAGEKIGDVAEAKLDGLLGKSKKDAEPPPT